MEIERLYASIYFFWGGGRDLTPLGYMDPNFKNCRDVKKLTLRCMFELGDGVIFGGVLSKLTINLTMDAEYVTASKVTKKVHGLKSS